MVELRCGEAATASLDDMVFGFLESGEESTESRFGSGEDYDELDGEDLERSFDAEESKAFWDEQSRNLQATIYRSNSIESSIRQATKEALKEAKLRNSSCSCRTRLAIGLSSDCRDCLLREVCNRLVNLGYDCSICRTKSRGSSSISSGGHSFLEVMDRSSVKRGEVRVVIELNFRAEFEMAKASEAYNNLIGQLPEMFVGKSERLRSLIKILCSSAKRCMKENNMHLGPWRKHKYMEAKWLGACHRSSPSPFAGNFSGSYAPVRPKASMLTFDLSEAVPLTGLRQTVVV